MIFIGRNDAINFIEGYGSMILEAKKETAEDLAEQEGTGLKIFIPKQLLQRLPIGLAQVTLKKVYNNIIKSMQL